jgi:hypothetical protein
VVEHFLGKEEVKGSIPFNGSKRYLIIRIKVRARVPCLRGPLRQKFPNG